MIGQLATVFERDGAAVVVRLPPGVRFRYSTSASPDVPGDVWADGSGEIRIADDGRPLYLHLDGPGLAGKVVGPRRVWMDGTLNFRDLGGYQGIEGRSLRWGRVFRSDHLGALSDADVAKLDALGVGVVIDFRSDAELAEHGKLHDHPAARHIDVRRQPIVESMVDQVTPLERIMRREITSWTAQDMAGMYRSMLDGFAAQFGAVIEATAAATDHAVVFHCTAGKDRTGLAAALLLGALGVAAGDIVADYELTNRYRTERRLAELRPRFAAAGIDIEPLMAFFAPPKEAMIDALGHLERRYGGARGYLTGAGGVAAETLDRLQDTLLAPSHKP